MTTPIRCTYATGDSPTDHASVGDALSALRSVWPRAVAYSRDGHALSPLAPELPALVWPSPEASENDDGARAVAELVARA